MLLDAILQTHAWASARFKRKTQLECQKLEDQNLRILNTEKEQGMSCSPTPSSSGVFRDFYYPSLPNCVINADFWLFVTTILEKAREGLADFVIKMKNALAALTGQVH